MFMQHPSAPGSMVTDNAAAIWPRWVRLAPAYQDGKSGSSHWFRLASSRKSPPKLQTLLERRWEPPG